MKKTQLNKKHRERLCLFVGKKITTEKEAEIAFKAVFDVQVKILIEEIENKYPQDHMRILQIYGKAYVDRCLKLVAEEGKYTYDKIQIPDDFEFPLVPAQDNRCRGRFISERAYYAFSEIFRNKKIFNEAVEKLKQDYINLITGSKTFEALCDIWPEASEIASEIVNSSALPATINPELVRRIQADMLKRQEAAA
jgi:hypothetical protein